jgi:hypothetical protein
MLPPATAQSDAMSTTIIVLDADGAAAGGAMIDPVAPA